VKSLQGGWVGIKGTDTMIILFMGNACSIALNSQQVAGTWSVQGNRLDMRFQNGKAQSFNFILLGDTLILDGVTLTRQQIPGQQTPQNVNGGGQQQAPQPGGTWQPQATAAPLDGTWGAVTPNGLFIFTFTGNHYFVSVNGMQIEEGTYSVNGDLLIWTVTQGQAAGQTGTHQWRITGNLLIIMTPKGPMQLIRQ
jgi:hypothetical protein